jgi:NAD(P)-dependent dehydrogenase (short-subunit alcohol dehydrogenase family)
MSATADNGAALVTGGGKRLGRAIALGLAQSGRPVVVHYNTSRDGADAVVAEIRKAGGVAVALSQDLSDPFAAGALIEAAREAVGPLTVLVNSASLFDADSLATLTAESWRAVVDVNLTAPVVLMQAFAQQTPAPEGGAIVNILDTQLSSASPERFSYFCGKFGLEGATKLAAMALAPQKIRVNAVAPGLVLPSGQTQEEYERRQDLTPLGRGLGSDDIVEAVLYLVGARQVTGHVLVVDAGQRLMGFGNAPVG